MFLIEWYYMNDWGKKSCENTLNSTHIQNMLIAKQKFDVILMEHFNTDCLMGLAYKLDAPVIGLSSCALMPYHYERVGTPIHSSYMPSLATGYSDNMSFKERLHNWIAIHLLNFLYK